MSAKILSKILSKTLSKTLSRAFFRLLNRFFVVPAFCLGFGPLFGNPFTGYVMVLKALGRRTGRVRYTPLNYAIMDGRVYCLRGRHLLGRWYLNVVANPEVELILPGGTVSGVAEVVSDSGEALRALRQVLKGSGFGAFIYGFNPFTAPDEVVREKTEGVSAVRINPGVALDVGPWDYGGWLWIVVWVAVAAAIGVTLAYL